MSEAIGAAAPAIDLPANSIFLIGMMGVGKSTIGRMLADTLGRRFYDCDRELEARSGVTISTIFEVEGEQAFRRRESVLLDELSAEPGVVLATGGGVVLSPENSALLRRRGLVIYLQSTLDEIARRTARDRTRPLLQGADPRARIAELLKQREPLYSGAAHLTFESAASNPRRLVERILRHPRVAALRAPCLQPAPGADPGVEPDVTPSATQVIGDV